MQSFPRFDESSYIKTCRQIHSIAKVIGKFRETLVKPIAKNDNLFLKVVEQGFCTPPIEQFNELEIGCNLEKLVIEIGNNKEKYGDITINGNSAQTLSSELINKLNAEFGVSAEIDSSSFTDNEYTLSEPEARAFLIQFVTYAKLLSDFWKSINLGVKSQICLWPHSFDNAFKWFSGKKIDEQDEFIGVGVSNGDDTYELPYVYMTMWPPLRKTNTLQITEGAVLYDSEWTGLVLPYDSVIEKNDTSEQTGFVSDFLDLTFASIQKSFAKR